MLENVLPVTLETLLDEAAKIKFSGYKLVTLSWVERDPATVEVLYHFDRDFQLKHLRLSTPRDAAIPSISSIFSAAFLVENEIQDLFGLSFNGLIIDFKRTLLLENGTRLGPLCRYSTAGPAPAETTAPESAD